jgi:hypothetical protein
MTRVSCLCLVVYEDIEIITVIDEGGTLKVFFVRIWKECCLCIKESNLTFRVNKAIEQCQRKPRKTEETKVTNSKLRCNAFSLPNFPEAHQ